MSQRALPGSVLFALALSVTTAVAATIPQRPAARPAKAPTESVFVDTGRVDETTFIEDAMLSLPLRAPAELDALLIDLQDPASPRYHQWLTPEQFGERFGPTQKDIDSLMAALRANGLHPTAVARARTWIRFSGPAARFERAFGSPIHRLDNGTSTRLRFAKTAAVRKFGIADVLLPDDLRLESNARKAVPDANLTDGSHALAPADWVKIYNVDPIYNAGYRGADTTTTLNIAVVGQSEIDVSDVQAFRNLVGLAANDPTIMSVGTSPGKTGDEVEGDLDVEWAGAIAPLARVRYYVAKTAGLAASQAVDDNFSSILSVSYGICESAVSTQTLNAYNSLFSQAASQGISVFVSSGDSGASGCEGMSESVGKGTAVNLMCTPSTTCVGGTSFNDSASPASYWSASNNQTTKGSALGYIPEIAWNESGGSGGLASSGGGASTVWARTSWQSAPGVPSGNSRLEPDIAAAAAGHVPYIVVSGGSTNFILGTSAAAPSVAGLFGLVRQKYGRLGNVNPSLYALGKSQYSGGNRVFHDVTSGNNSVPGVSGFSCGTGYDMVTGLGSVDGGALLNAMGTSIPVTPAPSVCTVDSKTACVLNNRFKVTVRYRGNFDNNAADTDALAKQASGFASASYETAFFYFGDPNNVEMMLKMLDQGNVDSANRPTIAVLFGSATPLRTEVTITDTTNGTVKTYTSEFGSQAGKTDFTAFVK